MSTTSPSTGFSPFRDAPDDCFLKRACIVTSGDSPYTEPTARNPLTKGVAQSDRESQSDGDGKEIVVAKRHLEIG
ncbi:MAG: hypothetical protein L0387_40230 [Acidobacteria bacterium]|nr:hypothetical protein [Acidobacteriota bacterium]